jgi:cystathionine beta-synthase
MKDKLKKDDVVVVIFHDHGTRYIGKIFNDEWMRNMGYIDKKGLTAEDLVKQNVDLTTVDKNDTIGHAMKIISENNFSQIPVTSDNRIVGSVSEKLVFNSIMNSPESKNQPVETIMQEAIPFVDITTPIDTISKMVSGDSEAVLVKDFKRDKNYIITRFDIAEVMSK